MIRTTRFKPSRTAVSISCEFIMNPPSPHTAKTRRCGNSIAAIIADGSPAQRYPRATPNGPVRDVPAARLGTLHAMKVGTTVLVERHERITGYATVLAFFGHAVAETNLDLQTLIASAEDFA